MRKKLIVAVAFASAGLVALVALAASLVINVDSFRPQLARALSAALGREVAIGRISLSVLSGSAVVENLSIADDPAFARGPFVTAAKVRIGIAVLPLVTSKHLRIESLRLQQPRVTLRRSAAGTWNIATFGASSPSSSSSAAGSTSVLTLSVDRLTIDDGAVAIETSADRAGHHVYDAVAVDVRDFSATTPFRFKVSARTPGGGRVAVDGHAGPFSARGLGSTPLDATVDITRVDLARGGLLDAGSGLGGIIDLHLRVAADGARIRASGTLRADRMHLVRGASPASRPVDVTYASDYDVATHEGAVTRGDIRIGDAMAWLTGRFNTRAATPSVRLALTGHRMPVTDLQALLPAVGATLPHGATFRSGVVETDLTVAGPIDRLVIVGRVGMSDATLSGFDLGSQMQSVASLARLDRKSDTTIQTLGLTLRVAPEGMRAGDMSCIVPSIGQLDGAGTIAPDGALDFKMLGMLTHTGGVAGDVTRVASLGDPQHRVPFRIAGTTAAPKFVPDLARAATSAVANGGVSKAAGALRSFFGKRKQ